MHEKFVELQVYNDILNILVELVDSSFHDCNITPSRKILLTTSMKLEWQ